jgi:hypothetical protein
LRNARDPPTFRKRRAFIDLVSRIAHASCDATHSKPAPHCAARPEKRDVLTAKAALS